MPIICIEGTSAVGKTATCRALAEQYDAYVVAEVNLLFERPDPTTVDQSTWYLERQVERWMIAQTKLQSHRLVVFDGDPFQPLWYNWIYQSQ